MGPLVGQFQPQAPGAARDDVLQIRHLIKLQPLDNAEGSRSGEVSEPARVVAPTSVNGGRSSLIERAAGPSPIMISSW